MIEDCLKVSVPMRLDATTGTCRPGVQEQVQGYAAHGPSAPSHMHLGSWASHDRHSQRHTEVVHGLGAKGF